MMIDNTLQMAQERCGKTLQMYIVHLHVIIKTQIEEGSSWNELKNKHIKHNPTLNNIYMYSHSPIVTRIIFKEQSPIGNNQQLGYIQGFRRGCATPLKSSSTSFSF